MNAFRGAIGVLLVELWWWITPPDQDPRVLALPVSVRLALGLGLTLILFAGVAMFAWGVIAEESWKSKTTNASLPDMPTNTGSGNGPQT